MRHFVLVCMLFTWASQGFAASVNRKIIAELDPVAPASASYEQQKHHVTTNKFGANVDFNLGGVISTGPEFWSGSFVTKGDASEGPVRREDLYPGERHKVNASRLRWTFSMWEVPSSMRGWYVKTGYNFVRIDSRANRYTEVVSESGDAIPTGVFADSPDDETDLITDERHGAMFGFGNRWLFAGESMTLTMGASFTSNFRREVAVDSKDSQARADYDDMINTLPDTRISERPTPEINLSLGYAW